LTDQKRSPDKSKFSIIDAEKQELDSSGLRSGRAKEKREELLIEGTLSGRGRKKKTGSVLLLDNSSTGKDEGSSET